MGENDSFTITSVLSSFKEDDNANERIKCDESCEEIEPPKTDDELERKHFQRIVNAFRSYKSVSVEGVRRSLSHLSSLPPRHRALLREYAGHLEGVREAVLHNGRLVEVILEDVAHLFHNADHTHDTVCGGVAEREDVGKVCSVFRQLFREWSAEGREERDASFQPILRHIRLLFPPTTHPDPSRVRILVPGAGLGRLPFEIARLGYSCQGNEFSLFMLFTSNFVLNKCQGVGLWRVFPWAHQSQNNVRAEDQLQSVLFPDVDPSDLPLASPSTEFSMAAGSFLEIYKEPGSWDCVCTCFFVDTARNVVEYVEAVWQILKGGGWWVNLGPLLYHHSGEGDSVEPPYEHIRRIVTEVGFRITEEDLSVATPYAQPPRSMLRHEYRSVFFVAHKPPS